LAREAAKSLHPDAVSDALLCDAQTEYLRGHWLEAESLLLRTSVYRRSGHVEKARQQLAELAQLPAARTWRHEIAAELHQLSQRAIANEQEQGIEPGMPMKPATWPPSTWRLLQSSKQC
jgi:hypothetical protein